MKVYLTHDNWDRPFQVKVFPDSSGSGKVKVGLITNSNEVSDRYDADHNLGSDDLEKLYRYKYIMNIKYQKIFIGSHGKGFKGSPVFKKSYATGNSVLLEVSDNQYVFIGTEIFAFETVEPVLRYESPIGRNDVPYPYAVTKNYTYLMLHDSSTAREPVKYYYVDNTGLKDEYRDFWEHKVKPYRFKVEVLHKRPGFEWIVAEI